MNRRFFLTILLPLVTCLLAAWLSDTVSGPALKFALAYISFLAVLSGAIVAAISYVKGDSR